ncbi:unnamed protein product [Clonostachys rosea]|uniref:UBC core domain-containing protein n=1 Tax=Bionectria ochroleuca TaxID=29856 RepID=A0ABY6U2B4_BIOOC|nr:unnamed protein product [Clonostachys rosea]
MEVVGLVVGVAGLAGLFSTCIQAFDLVQCGRNLQKDHLLLSTRLANQRLRFQSWGRACGLDRDGAYNTGLDDSDLRRAIVLNGEKINQRYAKQLGGFFIGSEISHDTTAAIERGRVLNEIILSETRHGFLKRISQGTLLSMTRWALGDKKKFSELISNLTGLLEDLEGFTRQIGVDESQQRFIEQEIATIRDVEELETISDARTGEADAVSNIAARRLEYLQEEASYRGLGSLSINETFVTAPTHTEEPSHDEGLDTHHQHQAGHFPPEEALSSYSMSELTDVSQNSRLMAGPLARAAFLKDTVATLDEIRAYGSVIQPLQAMIKDRLARELPSPPTTTPILKNRLRVYKDIERFDTDNIACIPLHTARTDIMTFFEGPPSTPYKGGIFAIQMSIPAEYPFVPPRCRFVTKIYHPNVDSNGRICVDILENHGHSPHLKLSHTLRSIASLLADPGLDDPLVPEIAVTYLTDRARFNENAAMYTRKYATLESCIQLLPPEVA